MSADPYDETERQIDNAEKALCDDPDVELACGYLAMSLRALLHLTKRQHPYYPGGGGPRANTPEPQPGEFRHEYADRLREHIGLPPLTGEEPIAEVNRARVSMGFPPLTGEAFRESAGRGRERVGVASPSPIEPLAICGVIANAGRSGEPLACGKPAGHEGPHAWATLPTFDDEGDTDNDRLARHRGREIVRLEAEVARLTGAMQVEFDKNAFLRQRLHGATEQFLALNDLMVEMAEKVKTIAQSPPPPYTLGESAPREGAPSEE